MVRHKNDYGYWENVDRLPVPGCCCTRCCNAADRDAEREQRRGRRGRGRGSGGWTPRGSQPPDVGTVAGTDHVVSFKTKNDQDRTIIADGDYSDDNKGFQRRHNDYGERREAPGTYFSEDRGYYTGPDH